MSGARLRSVDGVVREMASLGATPPLDGGGEPPHDGDMDARVAKLEALIPMLATKADVAELRVDIEKGQKENRSWMLATVLALFAGIIGAGGLVVSATKSPAAPAPQPAPIIIQVPGPPPAAAPAPIKP